MSQFPPSNTWHCPANAAIVVYVQSPFAYPATHAHLYACTGMALLSTESVHAALFAHGDDAHSSTSTSQFPVYCAFAALFGTVHAAVYSVM
jgi:hypothetical protein